ncbi:MAG: amidohydrolase family protein [Flavobacteriales bacterium]|nr:amidohydrolase family protein [Flavobacteriales bacterium]
MNNPKRFRVVRGITWSLCFVVLAALTVTAQETFPVNGVVDKALVRTVFDHAIVHAQSGEVLEDASVVVFKGRIETVGPTATLQVTGPAVREDLTGFHVYPSFVELSSRWGMPSAQEERYSRGPQDLSDKKGAYGWNEAIRPETRAAALLDPTMAGAEKKREAYLKAGFGTVLSHVQDGIVRGTGALAVLSEDPRRALLIPDASAHYSFRKGSSSQDYPRSLMGATALLKQTHFDATWYADASRLNERLETNLSLEAFNGQRDLPVFFHAGGWQDILRASAVADVVEMKAPYIMFAGNDTYQRLEEVQATGSDLVLSLDFPTPFDVSDPYLSRLIGLDELKHWELAPSNAARVHMAGIRFAFTTDGLNDVESTWSAVRKCIQQGLPADAALAALTEVPAAMVGAENRVGRIKPGFEANMLITDGPLFDSSTVLYEHWVQGEQQIYQNRDIVDIRGMYDVTLDEQVWRMEVKGSAEKPKAHFLLDSTEFKLGMELDGRTIGFEFTLDTLDLNGWWRASGNVWMDSRIWEGKGQRSDGTWFEWSAIRQEAKAAEEVPLQNDKSAEAGPGIGEIIWPFTAYGNAERPQAKTTWIQGATVWTCESEGRIEQADVILQDGKILAIGKDLIAEDVFGSQIPTYELVDGRGKHVTPGIIDEHTHIAATRGINEGTQASSAEVSIETCVNSEDVNIYRQLAGGVTSAQILHGSANPIGGQSAIIKFRWGASPQAMIFDAAPPFIKFALGENVKQSNWGNDYRSRFPQTRMGVEQVYYDHFIRAREYEQTWKDHAQMLRTANRKAKRNNTLPAAPRRDLELETLSQILNSERFVTCHSYRQDEINMLMHVADSMGFTMNTFTHILEGYKVADKMAAHGAGASSFSDWWAYKYEVKDAIPYNGAVLHGQGIVTAFNSDDAEMARRLNQEAAKAVKYGGVSEEEALKFVTLNPAKLLRVDHRVGSLAVGKDADVVVWSDHPLSVYAQAEQTFVDGVKYFDLEDDAAKREWMRAERARLMQAMKLDQSGQEGGGRGRAPTERIRVDYHCETLTDENR